LQYLEDMSNEEEEIINPQSWTQKELVKHLYREILEIKAGQREMIASIDLRQKEGLASVKSKQSDFEDRIRGLERDVNQKKGIYAFFAALIASLVSIITHFISK